MSCKCIYDAYCECFCGCEDCMRYRNSCDECYETGELYNFGDEMLCIDCLIKAKRDEFYNDFIDNNIENYKDFIRDACYSYKVS